MTAVYEQLLAADPDLLASLPEHRLELFEIRLQRWWPDLHEGLVAVYPPVVAEQLEARLLRIAVAAYAERDPELLRLDQVRTLSPDWFQSPAMVGYATYADRFGGDLAGVRRHIPYLRELGVTYLHLMPLLLPREGDDDGGYAVADYRRVRPDLGTIDDLRELATQLRRSGISLVLDLVLNHVAREHSWAAAARAGDPRFRAYFHVFDDREIPDAYERSLPEVFPHFAPGNFTWDDELRGWVWTTFNAWQWDLNWANPDVFAEYAEILLFLANVGVEVFRLDAIAFIWKRMGTDCQNQPEVHALTQALRALMHVVCPSVIFKAEAIVGPDRLVEYLGAGGHTGKVSDLAYHNALMVQVWSMLAEGNARLAAHALRSLPEIPTTTAWVTYVRGHDDIGWAIADSHATGVDLSGPAHRAFLSDFYAGLFPGSTARGLVFQHNPATGDRRISGTTASLAGLEDALDRGDAAGVEAAIARILLAYAIVFGWGGIPVIWMGDELGLCNDPDWSRDPRQASDNRWAHRPRMNWSTAQARSEPRAVAGKLFTGFVRLASARVRLAPLHAAASRRILELTDPGILPVLRESPAGVVLQLYNVTPQPRRWRVSAAGDASTALDALHDERVDVGHDGYIALPPYAARWLVAVGE